MKATRRLTDGFVKGLVAPASGAQIVYDAGLSGFRTRAGRERRYTIGAFPDWQTATARKHAAALKAQIRLGHDPLAELEEERGAPTVAKLIDRYITDYLPKLRPASQKLYRLLLEGPAKGRQPRASAFVGLRKVWGAKKVADITFADVQALHAKVSAAGVPIVANRLMSVLSRLFALSVRWGWRTDNPVRGIERNQEAARQRYLTADEIARLHVVLAGLRDQQAANIVRMLIYTGSRSGEVFAMRWDQIDLVAGVWTKPASLTKQRAMHRVPLSGAARAVLASIPEEGDWVFPSISKTGHRTSINRIWPKICKDAGLADLRPHDLRHSFASVLIGAGLSLPIIGGLLGHTQPRTTARYAHLQDDALRRATEQASAIIGGAIVPLHPKVALKA